MKLKPIYGTQISAIVEKNTPSYVMHTYYWPPNEKNPAFSEEPPFDTVFIPKESNKQIGDLLKQAWDLYKEGKYEESEALVTKIKELITVVDSSNPAEFWTAFAKIDLKDSLMNPESEKRKRLKSIFSGICEKGVVLEAFTGFNSLVENFPTNVVFATDYSAEALERYPHPERVRIQFDMDILDGTNRIGNFEDEKFDFIVISYGYKYPIKLRHIFLEFFRILKPGGILFMLEASEAAFPNAKRKFVTQTCRKLLKKAGFKKTTIETKNYYGFASDFNNEYFVEATK